MFYAGLCAEDGPERLCAPCGPGAGAGTGVPPAPVLQQSQSGGDPGQYLRRRVPPGHRRAAKGLRRPLGAAVRPAGKVVGGGGNLK